MFAATLVRTLIVGSVLGLAGIWCTCVVVKIVTPLSNMRVQREEIAGLETRKKQLMAEVVESQRMEMYLNSPEGEEYQARSLGWVKAGERPLRQKNASLAVEDQVGKPGSSDSPR